jgi:integrase
MGEVLRKTYKGKFVGWYLRYIDVDGRRKQRASHEASFADAKRKLAEIEGQISKRRAGIAPKEQEIAVEAEHESMQVAKLFERFGSEYVDPALKDRDKYLYHARSVLRRIVRAAPEFCRLQLGRVQPQQVARLRDALGRKHPAGTVRATLIQLSAVFTWAVQEEIMERNPVRGVPQPKAPQPSDEWLEPDEVRRLLDVAGAVAIERGPLWKGRHVAVALGVYLGLRLGEIYGLRWRDIDWQTGRVTVARSYAALPKSGRARHLKMPPPLRQILEDWRPQCPVTPEGVIVPVCHHRSWRMSNPTAAPRGLPELLKLASCRPMKRPWHALRHTFASNYLRQGGNIAVLQRLLGHAEIRTTMIYAHLAADYLDGEMDRMRY